MKAFTLIELILVVMILGVVVMTAANFELFGRFEVNDIDRASRLQNDVYIIAASLCKDLNSALGSSSNWPLAISSFGGNTSLVTIWVDYNKNGVRDGSDRQVAYGYDATTHQLRKYDNYSGSPGTYTILSRKVVSFVCTVPASANYMKFSIVARYDPASGVSTNNPEVSMFSSGNMPSVSLN